MAANSVDSYGETLGGFGSAIALKSFNNPDSCTFTGTLIVQPDRGHNTGTLADFRARQHVLDFSFTPYYDTAAYVPSGGDVTRNNFNWIYKSTLLYKDTDGSDTTGLDSDGFRAGPPMVPISTVNNKLTVDAEGLALTRDGTGIFYVSDEYGPSVYKVAADGKIIKAFTLPDAFYPYAATSDTTPNFSTNIIPALGRNPNQGFEGMSLDLNTNTLWVLMQSGLMQEGGASKSTNRHARLLAYNVALETPVAIAEYVVTLPVSSSGKTFAQSELRVINDHTFMVLARDGSGMGDTSASSAYKSIDLIDISVATNILGTTFDNKNVPIATAGVLSGGITAASYSSFISLIDATQLARFGLHNGGAFDGTLITAKWESIDIASVNDPAFPYINKGLVAFGRMAANSVDSYGETLGGFGSAIALKSFHNPDSCTFTGTLIVQPDRGHNTGTLADFRARQHVLDFSFTPYYDTAAYVPSGGDVTRNNFNWIYKSTLLYKDTDGSDTTGLDSDGFRAGPPMVPISTINNKLTVDAEGLALTRDGTGIFYVSDEYGPSVYKVAADGKIIKAFTLPDAFYPYAATSDTTPNFSTNIIPALGRNPNQGFEGMSLDLNTNTLWVLMQSGLMQEGGASKSTNRHARLLAYNVALETPVAIAEYVVTLPVSSSGKTFAQSELRVINDHTFMVLARDGSGMGDTSASSAYKSIDLIDISVATNILGTTFDNKNDPIATAGVLSGGITAASYSSFISLIDATQLARFGLHNGGAFDGTLITAKWESIDIASVNDPAFPNDYFVFTVSDNDFITSQGFSGNPPVSYVDSYGKESDSMIMVFRVTLPSFNQPDVNAVLPAPVTATTTATTTTSTATTTMDITTSATTTATTALSSETTTTVPTTTESTTQTTTSQDTTTTTSTETTTLPTTTSISTTIEITTTSTTSQDSTTTTSTETTTLSTTTASTTTETPTTSSTSQDTTTTSSTAITSSTTSEITTASTTSQDTTTTTSPDSTTISTTTETTTTSTTSQDTSTTTSTETTTLPTTSSTTTEITTSSTTTTSTGTTTDPTTSQSTETSTQTTTETSTRTTSETTTQTTNTVTSTQTSSETTTVTSTTTTPSTTTTTKTTTTTTTSASPSCTAAPVILNTFNRRDINSVGGNTGTGGTGLYSVNNGFATWRPLNGGYFYSNLYPETTPEGRKCRNITRFRRIRIIMRRSDRATPTYVSVGIDLGCGTKVFRKLATARVDGVNRAFSIPLSGDLTIVKAVVLTWTGSVRPTIVMDSIDFRC
ncbi:hypothetical protein HK098_003058 [Nowakowskiella sp. JEL0407]|nr:hypothetical protein HK098_003058 [Nowakowskiella sp. JEL0407]